MHKEDAKMCKMTSLLAIKTAIRFLEEGMFCIEFLLLHFDEYSITEARYVLLSTWPKAFFTHSALNDYHELSCTPTKLGKKAIMQRGSIEHEQFFYESSNCRMKRRYETAVFVW